MQDLLLEIGKFEDANSEKITAGLQKTEQMPYFIGMLAANRMCGTAYYVLKENKLLQLLNREYRGVLEAVYQYNCIRNKSFKKCMTNLAKKFETTDISYGALKGAYLIDLYPEGTRTSNDLDILISREDISKVAALLKGEGFTQGFIRNDEIVPADRNEIINAMLHRGETIPFIKEVNLPCMRFMEVDINVSLNENPVKTQDIVQKMITNIPCGHTVEHCSLLVLEEQDFLIHLCVHLYKEATNDLWIQRRQAWTLYKFIDIYLFCKIMFKSGWEKSFIRKVKLYSLEKECFYSLYNMDKLLKFPKQDILRNILDEIKSPG